MPLSSLIVCISQQALYFRSPTTDEELGPTSFMEVTHTVTLHSVTALDCGAVVMCVGSNMNSDGSTHTDQAAATLQVQGEMDGMFRE